MSDQPDSPATLSESDEVTIHPRHEIRTDNPDAEPVVPDTNTVPETDAADTETDRYNKVTLKLSMDKRAIKRNINSMLRDSPVPVRKVENLLDSFAVITGRLGEIYAEFGKSDNLEDILKEHEQFEEHVEKKLLGESESKLSSRKPISKQSDLNLSPSESDSDNDESVPRKPFHSTPFKSEANFKNQFDIKDVIQATLEASSSSQHQGARGKVKAVKIPSYDGKSSFIEFLETFDGLVPEHENATIKMVRLKEACTGSAGELIAKLQNNEKGYTAARKLLLEVYGGYEKDIQRYLRDARKFPKVGKSETGGIRNMRNFTQALVSSISGTDSEAELSQGSLYAILIEKLPEGKKAQFFRWLAAEERKASVRTLNVWLGREAHVEQQLQESASIEIGDSKPKPKPKEAETDYRSKPKYSDAKRSYYTENERPSSKPKCPVCETDAHPVVECRKFNKLEYDDRWNCAKDLHLCFRCLTPGHAGNECKKSRKCNIDGCRSVHHRLLHHPDRPLRTESSFHNRKTTTVSQTQNSLRTLPIWVIANGIRVKVNCCLDDGSTNTFVSESLIRHLGIKPKYSELRVATLTDSEAVMRSGTVQFTVASMTHSFSAEITAHTSPKPPMGNYKPVDWTKVKYQYSHLLACDFRPPCSPYRVDLLIGTSDAYLHKSRLEYAGPPGTPAARLGPLGWTAVGPAPSMQSIHSHVTTVSNEEIMRNFEVMWETESPTPTDPIVMKPNEKKALTVLEKSLTHDGVRYEIAVPWAKSPKTVLRNNYPQALKRLNSLERTFAKRPELRPIYEKTIREYKTLGFVKPVTVDKVENVWYLPHFAVIRDDKTTTKVRPVFDGSAKFEGHSLNDVILDCPNLQTNLFDVLLRFRKHKVAVTCDIQKMYLNIRIPESDRPYFRFLWHENNEIVAYEFQVVAFGSKCAPAQAIYVAQENARRHQSDFPRAAEAVLSETYMDDVLSSVQSENEAIDLYHSLTELWGKAGMKPHKWLSNSETLMKNVGDNDATPIDITADQNHMSTTKVLGQRWNPVPDEFQPFTTVKPLPQNTRLTLRNVLSYIATTYDPLGLISPIIVTGRKLIQEMYRLKLNYDDLIPVDLNSKFITWVNSLSSITELSFERCLIPSTNAHSELIVFSDASETALAAVCYMRTVTDDNVHVRFVASKTKICPMKSRTIPELELAACHMATLLAYRCATALKMDLKSVKFFTDSVDAIWWIRGSIASEFRPYVKNRINAIQSLIESYQWSHVKGTCNPADIASRGCDVTTLIQNKLWKNGPEWLIETDRAKWPSLPNLPELDHELPEKRPARVRSHFVDNGNQHSLCSDIITRHSKLHSAVRILSIWLRFANNCRKPKNDRNFDSDPTADEYENAEKLFVKHAQQADFPDELKNIKKGNALPEKSSLSKFQPFLDGGGVLRVGGRLQYASHVPFNAKHPIILSANDRFTRLLVEQFHEKHKHIRGVSQLLALINQKYWIVGGSKLIKSVVSKCVLCQKLAKLPSRPKMAPLVEERTKGKYPFQFTGCDLAGPFLCSTGPRRSPVKRWIIVWTCLTTRAVRLDIVSDLSEKAFLRAFIRFRSRNNEPESISSDCGSNFVSAAKTLKSEAPRLVWKFISPSSPWMGGAWEVMVRETKKALVKTLDVYRITEEELITALSLIEQSLNLRPLTAVSTDIDDLQVLTPESFLIEKQRVALEPNIESNHLGQRWKLLQEVLKQAWDRFIKEFLPKINHIPKWTKSRRILSEGDLVLVMKNDTARHSWPYGIISKVWKRDSDDVRVALVKMANGQMMTRPAAKLIPIDISKKI